jgi:carboxyl-terminal processing protease
LIAVTQAIAHRDNPRFAPCFTRFVIREIAPLRASRYRSHFKIISIFAMRFSTFFLSTLAFALSGAAAALPQPQPEPQPQPTFGAQQSLQSAAAKTDLAAVWQSPQQGYVIDLQARNQRAFHLTTDACWLDAQLTESIAEHIAVGRFNADKTQLKVAAAPGASETLLLRLDALPARCGDKPAASPKAVMRALTQTMTEHFAFFKERNVDWATLVEQAQARITDSTGDAQLYEEIAKLLSTLNDPHVTLQAKIDSNDRRLVNGRGATLTALRKAFEAQTKTKNGNAFYRDWVSASQTAVNKQLLSGTGKYALNDTAFWGINTDPSGNVGYLALTAMKDFTRKEKIDDDIEAVDTLLDTVFSACTGCKAIIVDLSQNRGGDDRVALAIAARFTDEARTAYTKQAWSKSAAADVQTLRLTQSAKPRWLGNVRLVTDSVTVSAAEVLTLAMRTLPKVKHVGQTTRGALSDALEKSLPNGWRFTLSNEIYKSANGEVFEARGIAPSEPAPVFDADDFFAGQVKFLAAVVAKMRAPQH